MTSSFLFARNAPARGRKLASAQQKARCGNPARASGAISVNMRFWKILVTRVKRFFDEFRPLMEGAEKPSVSGNARRKAVTWWRRSASGQCVSGCRFAGCGDVTADQRDMQALT
jgi:hypothetical protein